MLLDILNAFRTKSAAYETRRKDFADFLLRFNLRKVIRDGMSSLAKRSLYRHFTRQLYVLSKTTPIFLNLQRLYRPQLRTLLALPEEHWPSTQSQSTVSIPSHTPLPFPPFDRNLLLTPRSIAYSVEQTLQLLTSSPRLTACLASLSYHYHPHALPNTSPRRLPPSPPFIPTSPLAVITAFNTLTKRRSVEGSKESEEMILLKGVEDAWGGLVRAGEKGRVLLGRLERRKRPRGKERFM